jgi:hypothetical protein
VRKHPIPSPHDVDTGGRSTSRTQIPLVGLCGDPPRQRRVDRTDWKAYIPPLLFFKRICDVWAEETDEAAGLYGDVDPVDFPSPAWSILGTVSGI